MDRRTFAGGLVGLMALTAAAPAMAQQMGYDGGEPLGRAEREHAYATLGVGNASLLTSRLAQRRTHMAGVRQFADFEVAEQETIADILTQATSFAPPPPNPADAQVLDRLAAGSGYRFDHDYVAAQIDGHQRLLAIQDRYLSTGRDPTFRFVAMLARGQINEHLHLLDDLRRRMA